MPELLARDTLRTPGRATLGPTAHVVRARVLRAYFGSAFGCLPRKLSDGGLLAIPNEM
jgi:hypothetical protein